MPISLSCPYCNSAFALAAVPPDRKATCPRCGDAFPLRAGTVPEDDLAGPPGLAPTPLSEERIEPPPRSRPTRWIALGLGLVVIGFVLGMVFRAKPTLPAPLAETAGDVATPPAKLAGLQYLRPDANIVLAVQPGPLNAYAARTNQDVKAVLAGMGLPVSILDSFAKHGVPLQQIDHVVAGLAVGDAAAELRFTAALLLRQPLADEDAFLRGLNARRTTIGERTVYHVTLGSLGLLAWKANPTAWVFAAGEQDLPRDGGKGPTSPTLQDLFTTRLSPATAAWLAVDEGKWAEKPGVQVAATLLQKKEWLGVLAKGRSAVLGLTFEESPRLRLFAHTADEETATALRRYLQQKGNATVGGAGEWVMVERPVEPADGIGPLKTWLEDAPKP